MRQVAGGLGQINYELAVKDMIWSNDAGFTTGDRVDIYELAEDFISELRPNYRCKGKRELVNSGLNKLGSIHRRVIACIINENMDRLLLRMDIISSDLHQFHWQHYGNPYLVDAFSIYQADRIKE
jgi:hypothetical protein